MLAAAREITAAVLTWLDGLDDARRVRATFPFDTPERFVWAYTPGTREGLPIGDMLPGQRAERERDRRLRDELPDRR